MPVVTRSAYNVRREAMRRMQILNECCRLEEICAICHDDIRGSDVYHLPCGHTFHKECLKQQLHHGRQWATKCAVCRTEHRDTILQNPELVQYLSEMVYPGEDFENVIITIVLPHLNNISDPQYVMDWSADEGEDRMQLPNVEGTTNHSYLSPEIAYALLNHLTQHIGQSVESDDDDMGVEPEADMPNLAGTEHAGTEADADAESDTSSPEVEEVYHYNSEDYNFSPQTWTGTFYTLNYNAVELNMTTETEVDSSTIDTSDCSSTGMNED